MIFGLVRPSSAKIIDRIVAVVNDEIITLSALNEFKQKLGGEKTQKEYLDAIIEDKLTKQFIKKLNLSPEYEEVEAEINNIVKQQGLSRETLIRFLKERGMTFNEYRDNIKRSIENQRLLDLEIKSKIDINEEDIRSYYFNKVKLEKPKKSYHIRQLFFSAQTTKQQQEMSKKANAAYEDYKNGKTFKDLMNKYSDDPQEKQSMGDLGFVVEDDLIPAFRGAIKRLRINRVSPPIKTKAGYHIIQLLKVRKDKGKSFDDARREIQRILYEKEFEKILSRWIKLKREESYIKIIPRKPLKTKK